MTDKEIQSGNRFFVMAVPGDEKARRIYNAVPEMFTMDAAPEGWKRRPTFNELKNMMSENCKKENSEINPEDNIIEQYSTKEENAVGQVIEDSIINEDKKDD